MAGGCLAQTGWGAAEEVTGGVGQGSLGRQGYSAEFDFYCK